MLRGRRSRSDCRAGPGGGFFQGGHSSNSAARGAGRPPELSHFEAYFETWIEHGYAGEMEYLKRRDQDNRLLRSSLRVAVPWARSVIVCAANYNADAPKSIDPASAESAWIARYAWTGYQPGHDESPRQPSDYHDVLLARLKKLEQSLQQELGPFPARCYVDTGPLVERVYARYAGIGWIGKNTCIIDQELGSWLFLGVILTGARAAVHSSDHAAGRPLWQLHPMHRRLPNRRPDSAVPNGCEPVHLLSDN